MTTELLKEYKETYGTKNGRDFLQDRGVYSKNPEEQEAALLKEAARRALTGTIHGGLNVLFAAVKTGKFPQSHYDAIKDMRDGKNVDEAVREAVEKFLA